MASNKRCSNFGSEEVQLLITLVRQHQHVIECKKSGHLTWNKKEETWQNITNMYNARSGKEFRSVAALKQKYNNLKKGAKEKVAAEKLKTHKNGLTATNITVTGNSNNKSSEDEIGNNKSAEEDVGNNKSAEEDVGNNKSAEEDVGNNKASEDNVVLITVISENSDNAFINWDTVSNEYNSQSEDKNERSPHELEQQFNVLKKETKRKLTKNKKEFTITGGGEAELEEITDNDQIIIDMLGTQVHGLPSVLDCDEESAANGPLPSNENWSTYVPSQLKTPKNKKLAITTNENVSAKRTKFSSKLITEKSSFIQLQKEKFLEEHALKMDILGLKKQLLLNQLSEK